MALSNTIPVLLWVPSARRHVWGLETLHMAKVSISERMRHVFRVVVPEEFDVFPRDRLRTMRDGEVGYAALAKPTGLVWHDSALGTMREVYEVDGL